MPISRLVLMLTLMLALAGSAAAGERFVTLASTTSTEQSGLFGYLLPRFTERTGIAVHVVALGTGQALKVAANGDADLVLVHDRTAEERFVADGFGIERRDVMANDFVLVGPHADPAGIGGLTDAVAAFRRIAQAEATFISRGDNSGTHAMEGRLWREAGIDRSQLESGHDAPWYLSAGQGMGPTLNMASGRDAYTLADRGTWISFRNRGSLVVLTAGDTRLLNPYSVIQINPARHPHVKADLARTMADWLVSSEGQEAIAAFQIKGQQLFTPIAR